MVRPIQLFGDGQRFSEQSFRLAEPVPQTLHLREVLDLSREDFPVGRNRGFPYAETAPQNRLRVGKTPELAVKHAQIFQTDGDLAVIGSEAALSDLQGFLV